MTAGIPDGYHSITPYFTLENADTFMDFVTTVFAGQLIKEDRYPDGGV